MNFMWIDSSFRAERNAVDGIPWQYTSVISRDYFGFVRHSTTISRSPRSRIGHTNLGCALLAPTVGR